MSSSTPAPKVPTKAPTADDLMAMADDGTRREIMRGELRESPEEPRTRLHSAAEANIVHLLGEWLDHRPGPRGELHSGGAAFRIRQGPETFVGIDVAYASADLVASADPDRPYYDGPPVLAVEILSPSDTHEEVVEKVALYLEAGVVVWEVDPDFRTIRVHRPGRAPGAFNVDQELSGEPYLPGFRVPVARVFE